VETLKKENKKLTVSEDVITTSLPLSHLNKTPTDHVEDIMMQALMKVYTFYKNSLPETLPRDAFYTRQNGGMVSAVDYVIQAILVHQLSKSTLIYPVIAEEDAMALKGPTKTALYQQVVQWARPYLEEIIVDEEQQHIMNLIGYANYEDHEGYQWIIDPLDPSKALLRSHQPMAVHLALAKEGVIIAAAILAFFRTSSRTTTTKEESSTLSVEHTSYDARLFISSEQRPHVRIIDLPCMKETSSLTINTDVTYTQLSNLCKLAETQPITSLVAARLLTDYSCIIHESTHYGYAGLLNGDVPIYMCISNGSPSSTDSLDKNGNYRTTYHAAGLYLVQKLSPNFCLTDLTGAPISCTHRGRWLHNGIREGILACVGHLHNRVLKALQFIIHPPPQSFQITIKGTLVDESMIRSALKQVLSIPNEDIQVCSL
jgi:3'-phosphoadenosine 5'-phosphosulfate (PAPS) 3'-phosphatase